MKQVFLLTILVFSLLSATFAQSNLSISVTNIKNIKGVVRIAIFNKADGFPSNDNKAFKLLSVKIDGASANIVIPNIPFGNYAVVVFHDENNNNKLDTNFIGMPKEGTGTSNANEKPTGKPSYSNALFNLTEKTKSNSIKIFY